MRSLCRLNTAIETIRMHFHRVGVLDLSCLNYKTMKQKTTLVISSRMFSSTWLLMDDLHIHFTDDTQAPHSSSQQNSLELTYEANDQSNQGELFFRCPVVVWPWTVLNLTSLVARKAQAWPGQGLSMHWRNNSSLGIASSPAL